MKPINPPDDQPGGRGPAPSILDTLKAVDVSTLDRLIAIQQERARIVQYRARAEEKKQDVAEPVFARVMDDYRKRAEALDDQSAPLRAQATTEYRKLKALLDALRRTRDQAQLDKDELEFRHTVGELTDAELADKLTEPQRVLEECVSQQKELDAVRARFVDAFGSEDALEEADRAANAPPSRPQPAAKAVAAAAPPPPAPAAPPPVAAPAAPKSAAPTPAAEEEPMTRMVPAVAPSRPAEDPGVTLPPASAFHDPGTTADGRRLKSQIVATPTPAAAPAPLADADAAAGATMMLPTAALVMTDVSGARKEFPLAVLNGIGRSEENRIRLGNPGISRKHALIKAAPNGFVISDVGSQNGTFVNGERVTSERRLVNGDTIDLGSVKFVFHTPWPPPGTQTRR